jgi:hypothetical protein
MKLLVTVFFSIKALDGAEHQILLDKFYECGIYGILHLYEV